MAGFLDKIINTLKGKKSVLGIDISSSSIKLVQVRPEKGAAVLETYGELSLGPYTGLDRGQSTTLPVEKMIGALKDLLKEANVTTKDCGVAIPMNSSLINIIKIPDLGRKKMETIVPIEMRKYIPVPISEVLMDWKPVPSASQSAGYVSDMPESERKESEKNYKMLEIFVVAIHKETIENYTKIIKEAGLVPTFFEVEIFSTLRTISVKPGESIMVIDFGAGTTKTYIIESGIVRESHIINKGSQDITVALSKALGISQAKAEDLKREEGLLKVDSSSGEVSSLVVESVFSEANRVLINYQKNQNKNVSKVVLTGGGSIIKGLIDVARGSLSSDVSISDPFQSLRYPAFLEKTLKKAGPEFAVSIGVALRKLEELG